MLFNREHGVGQLESCVREAAKSLPDKDHRLNLVITMPMPLATMKISARSSRADPCWISPATPTGWRP